jgi:hypothetical protein
MGLPVHRPFPYRADNLPAAITPRFLSQGRIQGGSRHGSWEQSGGVVVNIGGEVFCKPARRATG